MDEKVYSSGPDLSVYFTKPMPPIDRSLPLAFDDSCKKCEKPMERLLFFFWVDRKPFASFNCEACKLQLYLFDAPDTPLLLWSDDYHFVPGISFSKTIKNRIVEREQKRKRRALREQASE